MTDKKKKDQITLIGPAHFRAQIPLFSSSIYSRYIIVGGGGGASNTGVSNELFLIEYDTKNESLQLLASLNLGQDAFYNSAFLDNKIIVGSGNKSIFYSFDTSNNTFKKHGELVTDFAEADAEQKVVSFIKGDKFVTGGADGVVRVWEGPFSAKKDIPSSPLNSFDLSSYLKNVTRPTGDNLIIRSISVDTSSDMVVALQSERGFLCSLKTKEIVGSFEPVQKTYTFRIGTYLKKKESQKNEHFVSAENKQREGAILTLWKVSNNTLTFKRKFSIRTNLVTALYPCEGKIIAIGCSEGSVLVVDMKTLKKLKVFPGSGQLPVTSLVVLDDSPPVRIVSSFLDGNFKTHIYRYSLLSEYNTIIIFSLLVALLGVILYLVYGQTF